MGAGKTKFTEGILAFFGLENEISSPTFTIVNEHYSKEKDLYIYHFDVYRLSDVDEFLAIGGDEYFSKGISIIEWGESLQEILPKEHVKIKFDYNEENENLRIIQIFK